MQVPYEQAHHCDVLNVSFEMNTEVVDPAGIRGNMPAGKMFLPGEVSIATGWFDGEVSRGHSTHRKRVAVICIGLTSGEGLNIILSEIRIGAVICFNG